MSNSRKLMTAGGGAGEYVDNLFSTSAYTGNGVDRGIVNGIDLVDKGGLVWTKCRSDVFNNELSDTERGANYNLTTNSKAKETYLSSVTYFNTDGYTVADTSYELNKNGDKYVSWTFAKQEGFFDIVTWTGDGVQGRVIPHNLGSEPGMITVKNRTSTTDEWPIYHRDLQPINKGLFLQSAGTLQGSKYVGMATSSTFTVAGGNDTNRAGYQYVAYLWAHDSKRFGPNGNESIIKCGSYVGNGNDNGPEIDLGWEPQWLMVKRADAVATSSNWVVIDTLRGATPDRGYDKVLYPNTTSAEESWRAVWMKPTGFQINDSGTQWNNGGSEYIYMAIRRPNKPAEECQPDELFAMEYEAGSYSLNHPVYSGFPVDLFMTNPATIAYGTAVYTRPTTDGVWLNTANANRTNGDYGIAFDDHEGVKVGVGTAQVWNGGASYGRYMFRRAPGFLDVVAYRGNGVVGRRLPHGLGVKPDMMWIKATNFSWDWQVAYSKKDMTYGGDLEWLLKLNTDAAWGFANIFNAENPTDSYIPLGSNPATNSTSDTYVAMLWASVPGICDIGTYTGSAGQRIVDCGFTNGARFVLIKRTDAAGDWAYFDTERGISVSGSPMLKFNEIDAQVQGQFVKPNASGFEVTTSSAVGIPGAKYIYMAIA